MKYCFSFYIASAFTSRSRNFAAAAVSGIKPVYDPREAPAVAPTPQDVLGPKEEPGAHVDPGAPPYDPGTLPARLWTLPDRPGPLPDRPGPPEPPSDRPMMFPCPSSSSFKSSIFSSVNPVPYLKRLIKTFVASSDTSFTSRPKD